MLPTGYETPIYRALHRHAMIGGAERLPVAFLAAPCGLLPWMSFAYGRPIAAVVFAVAGAVGLYALRRLAKVDPQFCAVFARAVRYGFGRLYAPRPTVLKDDTRFGRRFAGREKAVACAVLAPPVFGLIIYFWVLFHAV